MNLTNNLKAESHISNRTCACNQSVFKFTTAGLTYPGLNCEVKTHIWNTINCPVLTYELETLHITNDELEDLKSAQGTTVKRGLGLGKRSHYHRVLKACNITPIEEVIKNNTARLYHNIFQYSTPARELQSILLSTYMMTGKIEKGTLIDRVIKAGYSPVNLIFNKPTFPRQTPSEDGLVDSLRQLLHHENYQKPSSEEHLLAILLTNSF